MGVRDTELHAAALASSSTLAIALTAASATHSAAAAPAEEASALRAEVLALRSALGAAREEAQLLRKCVEELRAASAIAETVPRGIASLVPEPDERDRKRVLDHLFSEAYVNLGASKIAGVGVFAFRPIPAGVDPFQICNPHLAGKEQFVIFSAAELRNVAEPVMHQVRSYFAPLTEDDGWTPQRDEHGEIQYGVLVTGLCSLNLSWYLNHSDDPNVVFKDAEQEGEFNSYVTKRRIAEGEELTADYRELGQEFYALVTGDQGKQR